MKISRAALLPLLVLPLAACGSNVVPSSGEAHTMACRGYVLSVGNDDKAHVADLISHVSDGGSDDITADPILLKVRGAAASAGSTSGLSDGDFARFRALVEKIDALSVQQKILDDGTATALPVTALAHLSTAVTAVHKLCY